MKPRLPLRWQFLIIALANLAVLGLVLLVFVRWQMRQEMESFLMATAREKIISVSRQLTLDLRTTDPRGRTELLRHYSETYGVRFLLFDNQGEQLAGEPVTPPPEVTERMRRFFWRVPLPGLPGLSPGPLRPPPFLIVAGTPERYWVGVRMLLPEPGSASLVPSTLLLESPTLWSNPFFFEIKPWLAILAIAFLISFLCWLPLLQRLTHAITQMMSATAAVAEGHFDVRVDTGRRDELGRLGSSINRMAERLHSYLQGQKRFLGDVAHELRSPLGRMQVALGILEKRVKPEDQSYLRDLREDVDSMSALTTELLAFARAEMRPEAIELVPLPLRPIIERAVEAEAGVESGIRIKVDPDLQVRGDEKYLLRAFSNLVRNAVRYAAGEGPIEIRAQRQAGEVAVAVADHGPGVPGEALEKIFTPFFRLESARDRKTGGTGLGLAIARSSIEACEGTVSARNRWPHGLEVIVILRAA